MLRRLAIAAVVVQTLACAEKPCSQNRITRGGALQPAEGDPITAEYFPYGVEGEPLTGRIFAALTACEGDALRVWGDFTDEDGNSKGFNMGGVELVPESRIVFVDVVIPPSAAGVVGNLRLVFEPSLGERRTTIEFVAKRGEVTPEVVEIPTGVANCRPLDVVEPGVVACGSSDSVVFSTSTAPTFARVSGLLPLAAGSTVWSLSDAGHALMHQRDGGALSRPLRDDTTWGPFMIVDGPFQYSSSRAIRRVPSGMMGIVRPSESRLVFDYGATCTYCPEVAEVLVGATSKMVSDNCYGPERIHCGEPIVGAEENLLWSARPRGTFAIDDAGVRASVTHHPLPVREIFPTGPFTTAPPWFAASDGFRVLATLRDGGVHLEAWPIGSVVAVSSKNILLRVDPTHVGLIGR